MGKPKEMTEKKARELLGPDWLSALKMPVEALFFWEQNLRAISKDCYELADAVQWVSDQRRDKITQFGEAA